LKNGSASFRRGCSNKTKNSSRTRQGGSKKKKEVGDGLKNGVDRGCSSPLGESKRCMTMYISSSILTLTTERVFKMEEEEWEGI
jgi:hypothetical protein